MGTLGVLSFGGPAGLALMQRMLIDERRWLVVAAPYVERLRSLPWLAGALSAITAAVVGGILNLTVWFAVHVLFGGCKRWCSGR